MHGEEARLHWPLCPQCVHPTLRPTRLWMEQVVRVGGLNHSHIDQACIPGILHILASVCALCGTFSSPFLSPVSFLPCLKPHVSYSKIYKSRMHSILQTDVFYITSIIFFMKL